METGEPDPLEQALAAWRADIDSVPIPELLSLPTAVALIVTTLERGNGPSEIRPCDQARPAPSPGRWAGDGAWPVRKRGATGDASAGR